MNKTNDILGPLDGTTMRVIFLYVGQGESTLVLMPDGAGGHLSMLIDCNRGVSLKAIDLAKLLTDLLPRRGTSKPVLDVFVNTHPHNDHLCGLDEIRKAVQIEQVWHSGHIPSSAHQGPYGDLDKLIKEVTERGGTERLLEGSRSPLVWGAGEVHVLSPADYIRDEIADETPEQRDTRIHDQCAVLRIGYGTATQIARVMITGDSDKQAWMRITGYHGQPGENRVQAQVLSASHHGSYTFFKDSADDPEPYEEHLKAIAPERVIISAPDQKDSKHNHPDAEAVERYESAVGKDNVHHMGSRGWSFVMDVPADGTYTIVNDGGQLARTFAFDENADGADGPSSESQRSTVSMVSRVERSRPMGKR